MDAFCHGYCYWFIFSQLDLLCINKKIICHRIICEGSNLVLYVNIQKMYYPHVQTLGKFLLDILSHAMKFWLGEEYVTSWNSWFHDFKKYLHCNFYNEENLSVEQNFVIFIMHYSSQTPLFGKVWHIHHQVHWKKISKWPWQMIVKIPLKPESSYMV